MARKTKARDNDTVTLEVLPVPQVTEVLEKVIGMMELVKALVPAMPHDATRTRKSALSRLRKVEKMAAALGDRLENAGADAPKARRSSKASKTKRTA